MLRAYVKKSLAPKVQPKTKCGIVLALLLPALLHIAGHMLGSQSDALQASWQAADVWRIVLGYVVPWLGLTRHVPAMQKYSEALILASVLPPSAAPTFCCAPAIQLVQVAKIFPGNFFNMNPVHCLRSRPSESRLAAVKSGGCTDITWWSTFMMINLPAFSTRLARIPMVSPGHFMSRCHVRVRLGLYKDNGKQNDYYLGFRCLGFRVRVG